MKKINKFKPSKEVLESTLKGGSMQKNDDFKLDMTYKFGHSCSVLVGEPGMGKSYLIKEAVRANIKHYNHMLVFSGTMQTNDNFDYLPSKSVHRYCRQKLRQMMLYQWKVNENSKKKVKLLLVFDDVMGSMEMDSKLVQELFANHRHYQISIIMSIQYLKKLPQTIQTCAGHFICFQGVNKHTLVAIAENYMRKLKSWKDVGKIIDSLEDYQFLYVFKKKHASLGKIMKNDKKFMINF